MKTCFNLILLVLGTAIATFLPIILVAGFDMLIEDDEATFSQVLYAVTMHPLTITLTIIWSVVSCVSIAEDLFKLGIK